MTATQLQTAYTDLFSATKTPPTITVEQADEHTFRVNLKAPADVIKRVLAKLVPEAGVFAAPTLPGVFIGQTVVEPLVTEGDNQSLLITHILYSL